MKRRKPGFREGTRVVIVTPKFIQRVGYPKTLEDYLPLVDKQRPALDKILQELRVAPWGSSWTGRDHICLTKIRRELAYMLAEKDGFGGRSRDIHWLELPEYEGREFVIQGVRSVITGTYNPGWEGGSRYGGDDGDEPPSLDKPVYHRIVMTNFFRVDKGKSLFLEIPVYHLKLVEETDASVPNGG